MIRAATRADLGAIVAALVELNATGTAADDRYQARPDAEPALRDRARAEWFDRFLPFPACFVAEGEGGTLVGFVSGEIVPEHPVIAYPPTARVDSLWVAPEQRRAGVGRGLVARFREAAGAAGFGRITVSTLARDTRAVAFWRSVGFAELYVILSA